MVTGNRWYIAVATGIALLLPALVCGRGKEPPATGPGGPTASEQDQAFPLQEVSVFELGQQATGLLFGQVTECREAADANGVAYPAFQSRHPLYGEVSFPPGRRRQAGSLVYRFAVDESTGTGHGYDRLYLDLNRDGNLTNDQPVAAEKDSRPWGPVVFRDVRQVCFAIVPVGVPCDAQGPRPLEMMPRLMILPSGNLLGFVVTKARRGQIQIEKRQYEVLLGHGSTIAGWFDNPRTTLYVMPAGENQSRQGWRSNPLGDTQKLMDTFYRFSATPTGDRLIVHPYTGPLGTFEVGPGNRKVSPMSLSLSGSLRTPTTTVPIGAWLSDERPLEPVHACKLPVGHYQINYLTIQMNSLRAAVLRNYHTDGKPMGKVNHQDAYDIAISGDKPFVLELSAKAEVLFALPARDCRVKLGEELMVKAVLIDPSLDIMFSSLSEREQRELNPRISITRANGEIVAEGTMPFG